MTLTTRDAAGKLAEFIVPDLTGAWTARSPTIGWSPGRWIPDPIRMTLPTASTRACMPSKGRRGLR